MRCVLTGWAAEFYIGIMASEQQDPGDEEIQAKGTEANDEQPGKKTS